MKCTEIIQVTLEFSVQRSRRENSQQRHELPLARVIYHTSAPILPPGEPFDQPGSTLYIS